MAASLSREQIITKMAIELENHQAFAGDVIKSAVWATRMYEAARYGVEYESLVIENADLIADNEDLREALIPFAHLKSDINWDRYDDENQITIKPSPNHSDTARVFVEDIKRARRVLTRNRVAPGNHPDAGQKDAKNPRAIYCLGCGNEITSGYVPWCDEAGCQTEKVKAYRRIDCDWEPRFHPNHAEGD